MTDNEKLCVYCQHGKLVYAVVECFALENLRRSLVTGRDVAKYSCEFLRDDEGKCGPDGAWFKARLP